MLLMVLWLSLSYSIFSLVILLSLLIFISIKQIELKSTAVYYLLVVIVTIIFWVIGDLMQIIYSDLDNINLVLFFSRFATISSMFAMISTILFARVLTARRTLNSPTVAIAFAVFGGVIALTVSSAYRVIEPPKPVEFYKTEADLVWTILDAFMVLFAGGVFLRYLFRQRKIVLRRYLPVINTMIIGVIIAFFLSAVLYAIYAIGFVVPLLHLELVSASIGALIIGVAMIRGGTEAVYYSSRVFSLHIFENTGISHFACVFQTGYSLDDNLISGVAAAIASFAKELIGKEVFPREIDLGDYSLLLAKRGNLICLITAEFPTAHLRQTLENIIESYEPKMTQQEICDMVESYISFEPRVIIH